MNLPLLNEQSQFKRSFELDLGPKFIDPIIITLFTYIQKVKQIELNYFSYALNTRGNSLF